MKREIRNWKVYPFRIYICTYLELYTFTNVIIAFTWHICSHFPNIVKILVWHSTGSIELILNSSRIAVISIVYYYTSIHSSISTEWTYQTPISLLLRFQTKFVEFELCLDTFSCSIKFRWILGVFLETVCVNNNWS